MCAREGKYQQKKQKKLKMNKTIQLDVNAQ